MSDRGRWQVCEVNDGAFGITFCAGQNEKYMLWGHNKESIRIVSIQQQYYLRKCLASNPQIKDLTHGPVYHTQLLLRIQC